MARSYHPLLVAIACVGFAASCGKKNSADDFEKAAGEAMQMQVGDCEDYPVKDVDCACFKTLVSEKADPGLQSALDKLAKSKRGDVFMKAVNIGQVDLEALTAITMEAETVCAP